MRQLLRNSTVTFPPLRVTRTPISACCVCTICAPALDSTRSTLFAGDSGRITLLVLMTATFGCTAATSGTRAHKAGKTAADIDWLVPHQANIRIMQSTAKRLKLPMDKVIVTVDQHGNTSAASIPLALDSGVRNGQIQKGQTLMLEGVGGGFTWGAVLLNM